MNLIKHYMTSTNVEDRIRLTMQMGKELGKLVRHSNPLRPGNIK